MQPLPSTVDRESTAYQANYAAMRSALERLSGELKHSTEGGGEKYVQRHIQRGKLLPRDRVEMLLDEGSYFLEIAPLAGFGMENEFPGAGVIGGIGLVCGRECLIIANEATAKGGATSEAGLWKNGRLADIARINHLPTILLVESAGADLPVQSKIFVPGGRGFREITRRSRQRIPTVSVVFGSSTAGGAYLPGMSDYVVMVKGQAQVFLAGPPLVKMATGEVSSEEELGGAEMHSRVSGLSDYLAEDELDAIRIAREIVACFNLPKPPVPNLRPAKNPAYPAEDLLGIASMDVRVPFEIRDVIARIVDGSEFAEFKPEYGPTLVTGFAHIHGFPIGILGNNGVLMSESSGKGAQFIQLCNQQNVPLLFLQNITGFMVGRVYEEDGIIRNGAKLINAVSNSTVPAITIMVGGSYGAGNYAMCGRAYDPRFLFTWPNHRIAVMGEKQLSGVMDIIKREAAAKTGQPIDEAKLAFGRKMLEDQIQRESDCYFATARLWDDGIIDPRDTRTVVAIALSAAYNAPVEGTMEWGVFRH
ncbi:MAG TPA: carboxyl transferase domain-containing protein [Candidatus Limnocylindrales bacterium]|nr:carboxyl transferase domain-containing protein [Candidatus Limnocylindrales bacterium]